MRFSIPRLALALGAVALLPGVTYGQASKPAKVKITTPANGATVSGPVKVTLQATGVEIVPATDERPGTGHHHLFVDHDLTPVDDTIPRGVTGILHLGRGQGDLRGADDHREAVAGAAPVLIDLSCSILSSQLLPPDPIAG